MKDADEVLTSRKYESPNKSGGGVPGGAIQWANLDAGTMVQLECDGVDVLVDVVEVKGTRIVGRIRGFEQYTDYSLQGLVRDEEIEFSERKIHSLHG